MLRRELSFSFFPPQVNPYVPARGVDALPAPYNSVSSTVRALIAQDKVTGLCAFTLIVWRRLCRHLHLLRLCHLATIFYANANISLYLCHLSSLIRCVRN